MNDESIFALKDSNQKSFVLFSTSSAYFVILAGVIGLLSFYQSQTLFIYWFIKISQTILFITAGYFFLYFNKKKNRNSFLISEALQASAIICILLIGVYLFKDKSLVLTAFTGTAAFLLPSCIYASFDIFIHIPPPQFIPWFPQEHLDDKTKITLNSIYISFTFSKRYINSASIILSCISPGYKKLGDVFSKLIFSESERSVDEIEYYTKEQELYAWNFLLKRSLLN